MIGYFELCLDVYRINNEVSPLTNIKSNEFGGVIDIDFALVILLARVLFPKTPSRPHTSFGPSFASAKGENERYGIRMGQLRYNRREYQKHIKKLAILSN